MVIQVDLETTLILVGALCGCAFVLGMLVQDHLSTFLDDWAFWKELRNGD